MYNWNVEQNELKARERIDTKQVYSLAFIVSSKVHVVTISTSGIGGVIILIGINFWYNENS